MSIVALKRKTAAKANISGRGPPVHWISQGPHGNFTKVISKGQGFSLNGGYRNRGVVLSTANLGKHGHEGCCYNDHNMAKPSVINTKGMLAKKNLWLSRQATKDRHYPTAKTTGDVYGQHTAGVYTDTKKAVAASCMFDADDAGKPRCNYHGDMYGGADVCQRSINLAKNLKYVRDESEYLLKYKERNAFCTGKQEKDANEKKSKQLKKAAEAAAAEAAAAVIADALAAVIAEAAELAEKTDNDINNAKILLTEAETQLDIAKPTVDHAEDTLNAAASITDTVITTAFNSPTVESADVNSAASVLSEAQSAIVLSEAAIATAAAAINDAVRTRELLKSVNNSESLQEISDNINTALATANVATETATSETTKIEQLVVNIRTILIGTPGQQYIGLLQHPYISASDDTASPANAPDVKWNHTIKASDHYMNNNHYGFFFESPINVNYILIWRNLGDDYFNQTDNDKFYLQFNKIIMSNANNFTNVISPSGATGGTHYQTHMLAGDLTPWKVGDTSAKPGTTENTELMVVGKLHIPPVSGVGGYSVSGILRNENSVLPVDHLRAIVNQWGTSQNMAAGPNGPWQALDTNNSYPNFTARNYVNRMYLSPFKSTVQWVYISLQNTHDCDALEFFPPAADPAVGSQFEKSKSYGINITLGYESSPAF